VESMQTSQTLLLIVNPCAGQKKAKRYLTDIIQTFNRGGYRVITHITACQKDAERAVLMYADTIDMVVCCGGDGTFNETISGVLKSGKKLPIGYIPAGSTNDFAASLHLSSNIMQATRDIANGTVKELDVGCFNGRFFSYVASFGAFTKASYATPQNVKNILGHAAYVLSGVQEVTQLRSYPLRVTLPDGEVIEDNFIFGAVANSTSLGGILTLSEERVDLSDGQLELLLIRKPKDLLELSDCIRAIQKQTYDCKMLTFRNASHFRIQAPADMNWTLDGEMEPGGEIIDVECLHHAITFIQSPTDNS